MPARKVPAQPAGWREIGPHALLSLAAFVGGLVFVVILLRNAELVKRTMPEGQFFYLILLPLGMSVAAFLFGALRSVALYKGSQFGGALELGGPIVGFALVVWIGLSIRAPDDVKTFHLTVFVHGPGGKNDIVLRNRGAVLLDLGGNRAKAQIREDGQAIFAEIPPSFRNQLVTVGIEDADYELVDGRQRQLGETSLYLEVRRKPIRIVGNVVDEQGKAVQSAEVTVAGARPATTDPFGNFELVVPPERTRDDLTLQVHSIGFEPWHGAVVPNGGPTTIVLDRERRRN
ncbi:MAG: hypothetical protein QOE68_3787 [Thermoanaerobaculia bacterium]|jgi:hypothetical protein|nr:hypothetical protein [Thermoanaerobaculia bacterium]